MTCFERLAGGIAVVVAVAFGSCVDQLGLTARHAIQLHDFLSRTRRAFDLAALHGCFG